MIVGFLDSNVTSVVPYILASTEMCCSVGVRSGSTPILPGGYAHQVKYTKRVSREKRHAHCVLSLATSLHTDS